MSDKKAHKSPDNNLETVIEKFYFWEKTTPDAIFLRQPTGDNWHDISFAVAGSLYCSAPQ